MLIIYKDTDKAGSPRCCVVNPSGALPVEIVARKDVPQGVPYKIVPPEAIPSDREFRDAWEVDIDVPDGYGDPDGYWAEQNGQVES